MWSVAGSATFATFALPQKCKNNQLQLLIFGMKQIDAAIKKLAVVAVLALLVDESNRPQIAVYTAKQSSDIF